MNENLLQVVRSRQLKLETLKLIVIQKECRNPSAEIVFLCIRAFTNYPQLLTQLLNLLLNVNFRSRLASHLCRHVQKIQKVQMFSIVFRMFEKIYDSI